MSLSFEQRIEIAKRIKASNKDIKLLEFMEQLQQVFLEEQQAKKVDLHRWATLLAHSDWELCLKVLIARESDSQRKENLWQIYQERFKQLELHIQRLRMGKPLISAAMLQKHGIKPGKHMGLLLKEAERMVITEDLQEPESVLAKLATLSLWKAAL